MPPIDTILPLIADLGSLAKAKARARVLLSRLFDEADTALMTVVGSGEREALIHGRGVGFASLPGMLRRVVWVREPEVIANSSWSHLLPGTGRDPKVVKFFSASDRTTPAAQYDIWDGSNDLRLILGFAKAEV